MFDLYRDIFNGKFDFYFSQLTDDITNDGWQEHATPKTVCDWMIEKYEYKQTDKILVLFNAELIMSLYTKFSDEFIFSNVYFIADTEKKNNYIKKYLPRINCKYLNKENWSVDKLIETIKEFNMPKHFDVIFTNPPYNNGLDLKLIKSLIDNNITDKIIAVHPGTFLFNHNDNKHYEELKNSKKLEKVIFFWGNEIFNIGLFVPVCISVWNKEYNNDVVTVCDKAFTKRKEVYNTDDYVYDINVNDITIHSKVAQKAIEMLKKFINCDNILNHRVYIDDVAKRTDYGIKFPSLRGNIDNENGYKDDFFTCFTNDKKTFESGLINKTNVTLNNFIMKHEGYKKYYPMWYFNTEAERTNFINYCKLKCTRFLFSLIKHSSEINTCKPCRIIPWMDFTKHYSEEDLKKIWGIDEELWDYIDKFIPDYYEDYKEIAK